MSFWQQVWRDETTPEVARAKPKNSAIPATGPGFWRLAWIVASGILIARLLEGVVLWIFVKGLQIPLGQ